MNKTDKQKGRVMTNGEKIKEIFPNFRIEEMSHTVWVGYEAMSFRRDWWSAEYKEPTTKNEVKYCDRNICLKNEYNNIGCEDCEVTKSQEPTTKNNLVVDAISRQEVLDLIADYDLSMGQVVRGIHALPSVTQQELRWIPVSERLPEINEEAYSNYVLLSLRKTEWDIDKCQMVHITTIGYYDANAISSDGVYMDTEGWVLENGRRLPLSDVIAWMPLPQVYSEVEK